MDTVHDKANECQTSILGQLHRNRMASNMAIKMFTILNGYRYNIHFVSMLLSEMVTSAEINLINLYQYTLKRYSKTEQAPLIAELQDSLKLFIINLHLIHCPSNDRLCFSKESGHMNQDHGARRF